MKKADAWIVERSDGTKEVVLPPITDDTHIGYGDEAWPLYKEADQKERQRVIALLVAVARAAHFALDDSEEREGEDGRCHVIPGASFDALSDALDALDELPDDKPQCVMTGPAKAEWALMTHNVKISGAGTASAGLPGSAAGSTEKGK